MPALDGVRVLEIGTFVSAPYCGKLFAGYGAEVIKVEPPGGDIARAHGPFPGGRAGPEASALFLYLNTGKKSLELDITSPSGRDAFLRLVEKSDVIIENYRPVDLRAQGLSWDVIRETNRKAVMVSITAYGQDGPYSGYLSNNLTAMAMGGHMWVTGTEDGGPLKNAGYQADYQGGLNGFSAGMLALLAAERDGEGQQVDVAQMQCMAPILEAGIPFYSYMGRWDGVRRGNHQAPFIGIYPCIDGHVGIHVMASNWRPFCEAIDRPDLIDDPRFASQADRVLNGDELMAEFYGWAATVKKKEIYAKAGPLRAPLSYVHTMEDLIDSPQLKARGSIRRIDHPVAGEGAYAGPPWWLGPDGWVEGRAPLLGEHTDEVLALAGLDGAAAIAAKEETAAAAASTASAADTALGAASGEVRS